ncbi:hypothetical protein [Staphylococcus aureus]|nr:hypothetical protein [Staphylococcus aureus]ACY12624.1 hypothetical protein SAAV_c05 [Staphylococcus aureus subsp. aureus ED98]MCS5328552.1 hypothetical protein [Staphylococcus aureus]MDT3107866.1 hypothetical protein [Staphylococcus aureus]MDT3115876.1 hypothetical protein [Staphylococcus aureus]MDT3139679.1 hypothetical protein [Staphylococcus aureus]
MYIIYLKKGFIDISKEGKMAKIGYARVSTKDQNLGSVVKLEKV